MTSDPQQNLETIEETFKKLQEALKRAEHNNNALPDCFVWGQTLDNQKDYFKQIHTNEDEYRKKLSDLEPQIKEAYEKFFPIFDRTSDLEIIDLLYRSIEVIIDTYQEKFGVIGEMTNEQLTGMLSLRDEIKILFDELEVWLDKFEQKNQQTFEKKSQLFEKLKIFDQKLRDELIIHNKFHVPIRQEAERRLIRKPTGTERYNFWWWHAGE